MQWEACFPRSLILFFETMAIAQASLNWSPLFSYHHVRENYARAWCRWSTEESRSRRWPRGTSGERRDRWIIKRMSGRRYIRSWPLIFVYITLMLVFRGRLDSANFIIVSALQIVIKSIILTSPTGVAFQWMRFARRISEWYVDGPIVGLYVLQVAYIIILSSSFREALRAAQVATLFDLVHGGILQALLAVSTTLNIIGLGGPPTVIFEGIVTALLMQLPQGILMQILARYTVFCAIVAQGAAQYTNEFLYELTWRLLNFNGKGVMVWSFYVLILPRLVGLGFVLAAAASAGRVTLHSVMRDFLNGFRELLMWLCGFGTASGMKSVPITLSVFTILVGLQSEFAMLFVSFWTSIAALFMLV